MGTPTPELSGKARKVIRLATEIATKEKSPVVCSDHIIAACVQLEMGIAERLCVLLTDLRKDINKQLSETAETEAKDDAAESETESPEVSTPTE